MELIMNSVKHYVYWIHHSSHENFYKEGYVGVSNNVTHRIAQHVSACKHSPQTYVECMSTLINNGDFEVTVLFEGSEDFCYEKELELRKGCNIGWNRRAGGKGFRNHIDEKVNKAHRRLLNVCKTKGLTVCEEWLGFYGMENFNNFYCEKVKGTKLEIFLPETGEVSPFTVILKTKKDFITEMNRNLDFFGDGKLLANCEVAEILGLKPNTLATQRKRGWSNGKIFLKAWYNGKD